MKEIDELNKVRVLLGTPPAPSPEASAKAFGKLEEEMSGRVRVGRRWFGLGAGLVAAGAAAAVAIAVTGQGTPGSPESATAVEMPRDAVLAAAAKVELTPTGKYWYTDRLDGQSYIIRAKTGTYAIVGAASESFSWTGLKRGPARRTTAATCPPGRSPRRTRRRGRRPVPRPASGSGRTTTTTPTRPRRRSGGRTARRSASTRTAAVSSWASYRGVAEPADRPGQAREDVPERGGDASGDGSPEKSARKVLASQSASAQIWRASSILGGTPVSPKVRAGLMRALAAQPGIDAIGRTADPLGRQGVALASGERTATITGEYGGPKAERGPTGTAR